jgi:hypothetical protein
MTSMTKTDEFAFVSSVQIKCKNCEQATPRRCNEVEALKIWDKMNHEKDFICDATISIPFSAGTVTFGNKKDDASNGKNKKCDKTK